MGAAALEEGGLVGMRGGLALRLWAGVGEGGGRSEDAGIVLAGVAAIFVWVDVLGGGAGHEFSSGCVEGFDEDLDGFVKENFVGDDLGLEAGGFEFIGDVEGGGVVFGGAGPVGGGGEGFEVL